MEKYLLDTNVVSELRKPKPHGAVVRWFADLQHDQVFVSAATMGELQTGVELTRRQDAAKASEIERWLDSLDLSFQIVSMDSACFREWGRLMRGRSGDLIIDAMIAAMARTHDLIVATRNEKDFKGFGIPILNPFKAYFAL